MDKFTVEEINLMCVFKGQDRTGMIADIKNVIPHIQDSDMVELPVGIFPHIFPAFPDVSACSFYLLSPFYSPQTSPRSISRSPHKTAADSS